MALSSVTQAGLLRVLKLFWSRKGKEGGKKKAFHGRKAVGKHSGAGVDFLVKRVIHYDKGNAPAVLLFCSLHWPSSENGFCHQSGFSGAQDAEPLSRTIGAHGLPAISSLRAVREPLPSLHTWLCLHQTTPWAVLLGSPARFLGEQVGESQWLVLKIRPGVQTCRVCLVLSHLPHCLLTSLGGDRARTEKP